MRPCLFRGRLTQQVFMGVPVAFHSPWIVDERGVLWRTRRRLQIIPAGLPQDHAPMLSTLRYMLQPFERIRVNGAEWKYMGHRRFPAGGRHVPGNP